METLSRRELVVRGAQAGFVVLGAGGLGALAGCGGARRSDDLRSLADKVRGQVLVPGEHGYAQAKLLFNPQFDAARPHAIVFCETPQDVAETIGFAGKHGIPIAARSGGHSFGGYSAPEGGIVADVSRLRRIEVAADRRSVVLGPGVLNMDVYSTLGGAGLGLPNGTCPTVGVAGLTLGGGFGYSSRKLGLMADNLLELELVLASGERVTCSAAQHPDLFWASRGGGGGNFGITTSLRLRLHPVDSVSVFELAWRWEDAAAVIDAWQQWAPDAPDELFSTCNLGRIGGPRPSRPTVTSQGQYFGSPAELARLLRPLESAVRPVRRQVRPVSFTAAQEEWAACAPGTCSQRVANPYAVKSAFFADPMPSHAIELAIAEVERWPGSLATSPGAGLELNSWGGAINRVPSSATAFVHRDARFLAIFGTVWSRHDPGHAAAASRAWRESFYGELSPYASGYAYQNLIDPALADWRHAYYGSNYPRLARIKREYDPRGVFRFRQGIG